MTDVIDRVVHPHVIVGASLVTAAGLALRHREQDALAIGLAGPVAFAISKLLKVEDHEHRPRLFDSHPEQSFPSGHSAVLSAFALATAGAAGPLVLPFGLGAVLAVNASRVLRREHWPHDVVWADLIGIGCAVAATAIGRFALRRRQRGRRAATAAA